jgi:multiple sugar transport system substrate-binding protein
MSSTGLSRRSFLGMAAAASTVPLLAACGVGSTSGGGSGSSIKFWDMAWGTTAYNAAAEKLARSYKPATNLPSVTYQTTQWTNSYQTFAAALSSKTGPALSTGSGYQAFQFAAQNAIAYADNALGTMKSNGLYDDFLPGLIDDMKTPGGYVGVPWQMDVRVMWYRKSLLAKAGVDVPTDWDSFLAAGKALAKIGVSGFGVAAGPASNLGEEVILSMLINNGGGLFDEQQQPNAVTDRNVETLDFIREMVSAGITQPGAVSYSVDNLNSQWKTQKVGMGIMQAGFPASIGENNDDLAVTSPLVGPHGDKGALFYVNNIMMYKESPSQAGSEAFLIWYLQNMKSLWTQNVVPALPVLKSITEMAEFKRDSENVKIIDEWEPICKPFSFLSKSTWPAVASVEASSAFHDFTQVVLQGKTDSKTILTNLQKGIVEAAKSTS